MPAVAQGRGAQPAPPPAPRDAAKGATDPRSASSLGSCLFRECVPVGDRYATWFQPSGTTVTTRLPQSPRGFGEGPNPPMAPPKPRTQLSNPGCRARHSLQGRRAFEPCAPPPSKPSKCLPLVYATGALVSAAGMAAVVALARRRDLAHRALHPAKAMLGRSCSSARPQALSTVRRSSPVLGRHLAGRRVVVPRPARARSCSPVASGKRWRSGRANSSARRRSARRARPSSGAPRHAFCGPGRCVWATTLRSPAATGKGVSFRVTGASVVRFDHSGIDPYSQAAGWCSRLLAAQCAHARPAALCGACGD